MMNLSITFQSHYCGRFKFSLIDGIYQVTKLHFAFPRARKSTGLWMKSHP